MMKLLKYTLFIVPVIFFVKCKSIAKYTIDEKPLVKIDTSLLGIWKAEEDTDKRNYFLVQNNYDDHHHLEDYNKGAYKRYNDYYFITYMDHHGDNPRYEEWGCFISDVKNSNFINIGDVGTALNGYFFVRILKINKEHNKIITAVIADTTLKYLGNSREVRRRIEKNLDNPGFYSDTMHFHKISGYHASLSKSKLKAN